jgi:pimeloyl-ACP methyl ester carboxylesterase
MPRQDRSVQVEGARVHYQHWLTSTGGDRPGLLFVHGHGAHSHWWDFIAPAFSDAFHVVALDLSGAGDSQHREQYSAGQFAREMVAVVTDAGLINPVIVAHSFGGALARTAAWLYPDAFSRLVLVDSAISSKRREAAGRSAPPVEPQEKQRFFDTLAAGQRRFRLRPPQPCANTFILDYIAFHSLKPTDQGYCFKLDRRLFARMIEDPTDLPDGFSMIREIKCPVHCIYGRQSRFFPEEKAAEVTGQLGAAAVSVIEEAYHHVFLDQPLAFIQVLEAILASTKDPARAIRSGSRSSPG